jgi:hypothetical protein
MVLGGRTEWGKWQVNEMMKMMIMTGKEVKKTW